MTNTYQRETVEFLPVTVTVEDQPVTAGVEFAVAGEWSRPTTWTAAVTIGDEIGVMVENLEPGAYRVWARVTDTQPETPVIDCGRFMVT